MNTQNNKTTPRYRRLRVRAFACGLTVAEIARQTGYHRTYLSNVLNGANESTPALDKAEAVIEAAERRQEAEAA